MSDLEMRVKAAELAVATDRCDVEVLAEWFYGFLMGCKAAGDGQPPSADA